MRHSNVLIQIDINARTQELQPLQDSLPHRCASLADSACKRNDVDAAHHRGIRADIFSDSMRIQRERSAARLIALRLTL